MPQLPQLDLDVSTKASRRIPDAPITPYEPAPSQNLPTQDVQARGQEFASAAQGEEALGTSIQDVAQQQIDAQHATWLMNTGNQYKLQANQTLQDAVRNVQPGESISGIVQKNLDDLHNQYSSNIQSPELQKAFAIHAGNTSGQIMGQAQAYDFQERDRFAAFNYQQGANNALRSITMAPTYADAATSSQQSLGEAIHTIQNMNVPPDERQKMQLDAIAQFGDAQARTQQRLDPQRWLADHYAALSPENRMQQADNLPMGLRINNPGLLTGEDNWQGRTGLNGKYITFDTPENGIRALNIDLINQQDKHGLNTVQDIIGKYAPATENDTASYVADVSKQMGVAPDQKLNLHDDAQRGDLVNAIIRHENGTNPFHDVSLNWANQDAAGKDAGAQPSATRSDGSTRNADPVWNMQTYEGQQKLLTDYMQIQRQMRSISADDRRAFSTTYTQLKSDVQKGIPMSDGDTQTLVNLAQKANEPSMQMQAKNLLDLNDASRALSKMNPTEVGEFVQSLESAPDSDARAQRLALAEQFQGKQKEQIENNPLGYFARQGNMVPPVNFADPQTFQQRAVIARTLTDNYGAKPERAYFTPEESNQIVSSFNSAAPDMQRVMLKNFADGFGQDTARAAKIFDKSNPNFSYAASMMASNPDSSPNADMVHTAMDMVSGDKRLRDDPNKTLIPRPNVDQVLSSNGWQNILPPEQYDRLATAVQAVYAGRHAEPFKFNSNASDDIEQAAEDAAGGARASVGGKMVIAPPGVDKDAFEGFTQTIGVPEIKAGIAAGRAYLTGAPPVDANTIRMPKSSNGAFTPGESNLNLRTVGPGLYEMIGDDGKPYLSPDTPGGYALLRFGAHDMVKK